MMRQHFCPLPIMPTPRKKTNSPLQSQSCFMKNTADVSTRAPNGSNPASETVLQDEATTPGEVLLKNTPAWADWSKRHTVSLFSAICLAHNIGPSSKTLEKLRRKRDTRTFKFPNHLNTLKDNVRHVPDLIVEASKSKKKPTDDTKILLKPFIDWVKNTDPFPGLSIPTEFFAITPLIPVIVTPSSILHISTRKAAEPVAIKASTEAPTESVKLNKRWAQIMIAMAIKKYDLVPQWPTSKLLKPKQVTGLYGPVSDLCKQYKLKGSTDRTTVRDAFIAALDTLGEGAVAELIKAINEEKKSA